MDVKYSVLNRDLGVYVHNPLSGTCLFDDRKIAAAYRDELIEEFEVPEDTYRVVRVKIY